MTLTKADIVERIAGMDFTKKKAEHTVDTLLEIMKTTLEQGEDVLISGFGKFCVRDKSRRRGRNPATGHDLMLRERRVVTFKHSSLLKDKINRDT